MEWDKENATLIIFWLLVTKGDFLHRWMFNDLLSLTKLNISRPNKMMPFRAYSCQRRHKYKTILMLKHRHIPECQMARLEAYSMYLVGLPFIIPRNYCPEPWFAVTAKPWDLSLTLVEVICSQINLSYWLTRECWECGMPGWFVSSLSKCVRAPISLDMNDCRNVKCLLDQTNATIVVNNPCAVSCHSGLRFIIDTFDTVFVAFPALWQAFSKQPLVSDSPLPSCNNLDPSLFCSRPPLLPPIHTSLPE